MNRLTRCVVITASIVVIIMYLTSPEKNVDNEKYTIRSRFYTNRPTIPRIKIKHKLSNVNRREINVLFWRPSLRPYRHPLYSSDKICQFHFNLSDYNRSEAVIFQGVVFNSKLPEYRPSHQVWIYQAWQSAHRARIFHYLRHPHNPQEFNYTMTYSKHSDIHLPYGECVNATEKHQDVKQQINDFVSRKQKLVAWMVSHCDAPSLRHDYIRELSRHIKVDIYGACGSLICSDDESCKTTISSYKFYLAFENSLCGEYISEKLWRSFEWGLVPVVFGGLESYKLILPANSYIDVTDFSSPKFLADYIMKLDSNETLYRSYFNWKYIYDCGNLSTQQKMDRICRFLQKNKQQVVNMSDVWNFHSNRCEQENATQYLAALGVTVNDTNSLI